MHFRNIPLEATGEEHTFRNLSSLFETIAKTIEGWLGIAAAGIAREDQKHRQRLGRPSCFTRGGDGDGWQRDRCSSRIIEFQA
jgi:hypothetical protein